ncbi:hypothetical protein N7532_004184 [Penicillium argentinense]|uniref:RNA polymerase II subunit A C-terminal domain phosphatase n=1 Tax=Penicillium argentinense TaxID=1131581 RepID=A0A9W9FPD4_9EURO|nr:uncharacterized protein N7532_004184 [Penicillium argentinense]KAJ5103655.1 hypothetical protein N7532_004184 [Penicillium argentinense]
MLLRLPRSLHYPITVTSLLKREGDQVERDEPIFWYIYETTVEEGDGLGNKVQVKRKFPTRFESPTDGELSEWKISKGDVITEPIDVVEIEEPCAHEVQFGGLCAECGKDMTEATYNTEIMDSTRAPIQMSHDNTTLTVSEKEAARVEEDAKRRLLASRRLSLVVDLDQTIIHATVDPTVGEWKEDKDNPNYEALRGVRQFQLIDDGPGMHGCWYYIKLRPGLEEFLEKVAVSYELHIYTMGTRAYAQNIADIIDPSRKLFGDRILSRDESGSLTAKNLQRLFPVDTKMVVIIDDRGDVWRWSPNLIKVSPYDFFVGIGDINSSFLPKKQDIGATNKLIKEAKEKEAKEHHSNGKAAKQESESEVSALQQLVTMGGGDNPGLLHEQTNEQEETILHQVEDRPLLQKQKELDAEDAPSVESSESASADESQDSNKHRHHLLEDHDRELFQLQDRLERVHAQFFDEYDKKRSHALGGRVAALRGERTFSKDKDVDLKLVPDIKDIMPLFKQGVLGGVVVVFSGVLPLGTDLQNADISLWAKSFGVVIASKINARTTHLVAGRNRTAKVREATRYPNIKIVTTQWLLDSLVNWQHLDEDPYLLPVHPDDRGEPLSPASRERIDSPWVSSSEELPGTSVWYEDLDDESDSEMFKSTGLNESSHIGYDENEQAAVHDELKEFLGSDDESESDNEALTEDKSTTNKKRKRGKGADGEAVDESAEDDGDDESDPHGSRLSQRIKRSYERSTGLREVATASSSEMGETHPEHVRPSEPDEEPDAENPGTSHIRDVEHESPGDDDDDELEREMLAAFDDEPDDNAEGEDDN